MNGDITNEQVLTVNIAQVNTGEMKTSKGGKNYWSVGIKVGEKWANGIIWQSLDKVNKEIQEGGQATLLFYQEEWQGKQYAKWKFPTKTDLQELRINALEKRIQELEALVKPDVV